MADQHVGVVELRNYVLVPGMGDQFVDYFERHFLGSQEAVGMKVLGQYRVTGAPDRFMWIRGFDDMTSRRRALESFYDGPVWRRLGPDANAMMTAWDDVELLRPTTGSPTIAPAHGDRAAGEPAAGAGSVVTAVIFAVPPDAARAAVRAVDAYVPRAPVRTLGHLQAEPTPNDFLRLPVRQEPGTIVWLGASAAAAELEAATQGLRAAVEAETPPAAWRVLRLQPTPRTRVR
jgi:hypothetical protein